MRSSPALFETQILCMPADCAWTAKCPVSSELEKAKLPDGSKIFSSQCVPAELLRLLLLLPLALSMILELLAVISQSPAMSERCGTVS